MMVMVVVVLTDCETGCGNAVPGSREAPGRPGGTVGSAGPTAERGPSNRIGCVRLRGGRYHHFARGMRIMHFPLRTSPQLNLFSLLNV